MPRKGWGLFYSCGGELSPWQKGALAKWSADPWAFLTSKDEDGRPVIWTQDEENEAEPFRPFPTDKPYLLELANELMGPHQIVLIDKCRRMMVSTLCMLLIYHTILFKKGRHCMVSKQTEDLVEMLMRDKIAGVHLRTPEWFQAAMALRLEPANRYTCGVTGSDVIGVTENAALRHFRGAGASIVLIDEAAFQEYFEDMLRAAQPMAARIWAVTTANSGDPGAETFNKLKTEV